jgi:hypothetical protein
LNEGQRRRIAIEMETAIPVPVIFESGNGVIEVMIPTCFGGYKSTMPADFEFELVRIDANGKVLSRRSAMYKLV